MFKDKIMLITGGTGSFGNAVLLRFLDQILMRFGFSPAMERSRMICASWHVRLGGGVHADAIMDRIVHNAAWGYAGNLNR